MRLDIVPFFKTEIAGRNALCGTMFRLSTDEKTKMAIERQDTGQRMSKIVKHGNTIYLAGQVGDSTLDMTGQTETMLAKVDALLSQAGSNRNSILQAVIWVSDMALFAEMNAVWDAWVPEGHAPARACGEAALARPELLVEIIVVAAVAE